MKPLKELERADLNIIRKVYTANVATNLPFLLPARSWPRAAQLEKAGLLIAAVTEIFPRQVGCCGFVVSKLGVDSYNAAIKAQV